MVFTLRFIALAAVAPLLYACSFWWPPAALVALLWCVAILVLLAVDYRSIQPEHVAFVRHCPQDLGLAANTRSTIEVVNRSARVVRGECREWLPLSIECDRGRWRFEVGPSERQSWDLSLRPLRRGSYDVGPLYVRLYGPRGLAEIRREAVPAQKTSVIPDLAATRQHELRLRRGVIRQQGNRQVRMAGRGGEFESLRAYTQDDDLRWVDWKATARKGRPMTRQFQPETKQRVILALDLGRLMVGRSGDVSKLDAVLNCCIYVGGAAIRAGDAVGAMAFDDRLKVRIPAASGVRQTKQILRAVADLTAEPVETDFRILAHELGSVERRRALVVLFTDFVDETQIEDLLQAASTIRKRHRMVVAAVRDAELYALATGSPSDAEAAFGAAAAGHLLHHRSEAIRKLEKLGVVVLDASQQDLTVRLVERYLSLREGATL